MPLIRQTLYRLRPGREIGRSFHRPRRRRHRYRSPHSGQRQIPTPSRPDRIASDVFIDVTEPKARVY